MAVLRNSLWTHLTFLSVFSLVMSLLAAQAFDRQGAKAGQPHLFQDASKHFTQFSSRSEFPELDALETTMRAALYGGDIKQALLLATRLKERTQALAGTGHKKY